MRTQTTPFAYAVVLATALCAGLAWMGCDPFPQCSRDEDCSKPLRCHPERKVCEAQCTQKSDCQAGQICTNLLCVADRGGSSGGSGSNGLSEKTAQYLKLLQDTIQFEVDPKTQKPKVVTIAGQLRLDLSANKVTLGRHLTVEKQRVLVQGANLQVVNGEGSTETKKGLGNVIVGYNEANGRDVTRTGSHNVVVGTGHSYESYGGVVLGKNNTTRGVYASVCGGEGNEAVSPYSVVSGGNQNKASGQWASVLGGRKNTAQGSYTSISGGRSNIADGNYCSILGGGGIQNLQGNRCQGNYATITGGEGNTVSCNACSLLGGKQLRFNQDFQTALGNTSSSGTCTASQACR